jgi:hypothetical protein
MCSAFVYNVHIGLFRFCISVLSVSVLFQDEHVEMNFNNKQNKPNKYKDYLNVTNLVCGHKNEDSLKIILSILQIRVFRRSFHI